MFFVYLSSCLVWSWLGADSQIDPTDWHVKEDPAKGIYDAVILEDVSEIAPTLIERYRRVRILSENGKSAAEFLDPHGKAKRISGRVLTADGDDISFNEKTDLVEVLAFKTRGKKKRERILIPPGLTDDCVVEMRWAEPAVNGLIDDDYQTRYDVAEFFFVKQKRFILNKLRTTDSFLGIRQIWTQSQDNFHYKKQGSKRIITYTDVPAMDFFPYGNRYRDSNAHYLLVFKTFRDFSSKKPEAFWADVAKNYLKSSVFDIHFNHPGEYKDWIKGVKANLPADPVQAMVHAQNAFRKRMISTDFLHFSQVSTIKKELDDNEDWDQILGKAWRRGYGSSFELGMLFYHVANDLDLNFKLVYGTDVDGGEFNPAGQQPFAFSYTYPYYGVGEGNNLVLFAPQFYGYPAGLIPVDSEGQPALVVDPKNKWKYYFTRLRTTPAETHKMITRYTTVMDESFNLQMTVQRQVGGSYDTRFRSSYYKLPPEEKNRELEREWQERLPDWNIGTCLVKGTDDLTSVVTEVVSMDTTLNDDDVSRFVITPFPNTYLPLREHNYWPKNRTQDIFLEHAAQNISLATIVLPEGWQLVGDNNWKRQNAIGSISFEALQSGNQVTVRRDIVLNISRIGRDGEAQLKLFVAWMDEAANQNLGFRKQGGAR